MDQSRSAPQLNEILCCFKGSGRYCVRTNPELHINEEHESFMDSALNDEGAPNDAITAQPNTRRQAKLSVANQRLDLVRSHQSVQNKMTNNNPHVRTDTISEYKQSQKHSWDDEDPLSSDSYHSMYWPRSGSLEFSKKRVRWNDNVTVVSVSYLEDGASVVSDVSSERLRDCAEPDTGYHPYRTSSFERLHPLTKYYCSVTK